MGLESAGNQDVLARGQPEAVGDFSEVDERFAPGLGGVVSEEVFVQMLLFVRALRRERKEGVSLGRAVGLGYLDTVWGQAVES